MASITLAGILKNSIGQIDVGAIVTFTHLTTTGETIKGTSNNLIVAPDGAYSINLEYGEIRIDYTTRFTERFVAMVVVNSDSTATNLPDLLNASVPPTNAQLLQFQTILADTVVAKDAAVVAKNAAEAALAGIPTYGTAATADVTTSTTDTTVGRLIKQGDTASLLAASTSGTLGVGTSTPHEKLVVTTTDNTTVGLCAYEEFIGGSAKLHLDVRNDSSLPITMGAIRAGMTNGTAGSESGTLQFDTMHIGSRAERMRITSAGNVGIGTTNATELLSIVKNQTSDTAIEVSNNGAASATTTASFLLSEAAGVPLGWFRRYRDGLAKTAIGYSTNFIIEDTSQVERMRINSVGDILPGANGTQDLGAAGLRFDTLFATNGTINTSDVNEKQDIELLNDAEIRVAQSCKALLKKFRWRDMVEEKGEDARIHFGIIAQDLEQAFANEGLDAGRYGMFTSNTWVIDEETGEERTRLGVRYTELLAFIIAAL
jgi:hypothetical protein